MKKIHIYALTTLAIFLVCKPLKQESIIFFGPASTSALFDTVLKEYCQSEECLSSYAASPSLARQIMQGAPVDLYVSAHPLWMDELVKQGLIAKEKRARLFSNRLVLVSRINSIYSRQKLKTALSKQDLGLLERLLQGTYCWALGDPKYVPLGLYAKQALEKMQLWDKVKSNMAVAADAQRALHYIERGECELGIVYQSNARNSRVEILYQVPAHLHSVIRYEIALLRTERVRARGLFQFLLAPQRKALYQKYGFQP